ncbi:MAG: hypothetical protein PF508_11910 [Spirochaeta sp.]|nr:hypothetical protein [Spirochaeta sp.]
MAEQNPRGAQAYKKAQGLVKVPSSADTDVRQAPETSARTDVARYLALIGRAEAAAILKHLPDEESRSILDTMAHLPPISRHEAFRILSKFGAEIHGDRGGIRPFAGGETRVGPEAAREILIRAFGAEDGDRRFYEILPDERPSRFAFLEEADGHQLSGLVREESVATLAIMCANMPKAAAARLLAALEGDRKAAVVRRLARIGPVAPEAVTAIETTLRRRLEGIQRPGGDEVDGEAALAEILRYMDLSSSDRILHDLRNGDAEVEEHVRRQLNSPEDLLYISDRDIQKILQRLDDIDIATVLKGKRAQVAQRITANLSERRREMILMHRESLGPMRRADVDRVTADFMTLMREMAINGEIVIRLPGEDEWVE